MLKLIKRGTSIEELGALAGCLYLVYACWAMVASCSPQ